MTRACQSWTSRRRHSPPPKLLHGHGGEDGPRVERVEVVGGDLRGAGEQGAALGHARDSTPPAPALLLDVRHAPAVTASAVPDVLGPGLRVVFCGINPGRRSAAARAHFANPRNDFWRLLHDAGLTPRQLTPEEQWSLLELGIGVTNAAARTTPGSGDLRRADFAGSDARLARLCAELRPAVLAFVGKEAYRGTFGDRPQLGEQERALGRTRLFVLPSTSPANAAVPYVERLKWFRLLRDRIG